MGSILVRLKIDVALLASKLPQEGKCAAQQGSVNRRLAQSSNGNSEPGRPGSPPGYSQKGLRVAGGAGMSGGRL
ncbi:MAG: hypothetical protein IPO13_04065 [Rhodocyclaceae bacterium]|nr:hypothetical protein [Rhodocyclaceae bacterium]